MKNLIAQAAQAIPDDVGMDGVSSEDLDTLNPLNFAGSDGDITADVASAHVDQLSDPGGIVSRVIEFIFPIAGLILFVMIIWGGFEMMMGATNKKSLDSGKQRVTAAIVGFIILFSVYWIAQIVEMMFGVNMLGN